jgi:hypothetical protein
VAIAGLVTLLVAAGSTYLAESESSKTTQLGTAGTSSANSPVGTGYLAGGTDFVDFIQWNDSDGRLSGSAQAVTTTGEAPSLSTTSYTESVSGTLNGSAISLSFNGNPSEFGTMSSGSFTLNFPQEDGTLAPVTFKSASASQYNSALADLHRQVTQANLEATINSESQTVTSDIDALSRSEAALKAEVPSLPSNIGQDLATTKAMEQQVVTDVQQANGNTGQPCDDAGTVADDAGTVADDAGGIEYIPGIQDDLNGLRNGVTSLQSDLSTLQSAESALPSYQPINAPSKGEVDQAVVLADATISSSLSAMNGVITQANSDVSTAYQYVASAYQVANCGSAPTAPSPLPPVS